ncbi:MAG: RNA methyltransferase [Planctomycetes bacterium]|nr:RNA methyltransferase [Planctomycetota bacterium]
MWNEEPIRSRANSIWKRIAELVAGKDKHLILLEGERLVADAADARRMMGPILVSTERPELARKYDQLDYHVQFVEPKLFRELSVLKNSPGIVALCKMPENRRLDTLRLRAHSLIVVAHGISDPGNLGALARSAEAFGASALALTKGSTAPYSDKALRGSMGSLLRLPVSHGWDTDELLVQLSGLRCRNVCAATRKGRDPRVFDWRGPTALWLGAETGSLPEAAKRFEKLTIPISSKVESLNVTVAASVLLYESMRARLAEEGERRG